MASTGSFERGGAPRSVEDALAVDYDAMIGRQRRLNDTEEKLRFTARSPDRSHSAPERTTTSPPVRYRQLTDMERLRLEQEQFRAIRNEISRQNAWLAAPALAPELALDALAVGGALAARLAPKVIEQAPLQLARMFTTPRGGNTWAAISGKLAHAELKAKVMAKAAQGWKYEPRLIGKSGEELRPDVMTPPRVRAGETEPRSFLLELKPDTPTGRTASAKAVTRYSEELNTRVRALFHKH